MRILYSPALHFILIGGILFVAVFFSHGEFSPSERRKIFVPRYSIDSAVSQLKTNLGRPPTEVEYQNIIDTMIDQEVLYQYALDLGIDKQPVVEERLAKISRFVEENPHEPQTNAERATEAMDLGLHEGDLVVRRILIDGSKRLIRAAVLMRVPSDEMLQDYLDQNRESFLLPEKTRITQITVNELKYGEKAEARAKEILTEINENGLGLNEAVKLEEKAFNESTLPPLYDKEIERKFGHQFDVELKNAPVGEWYGPIQSRYGLTLVYVNERIPPELPPLDQIKTQVKGKLLNKLADEWLELRLEQLKEQYEIVIEGDKTS